MKLLLTMQDQSVYESDIIISGFVHTDIYYNALSPADNSIKLSIPFSLDIANALKTHCNDTISAVISNDNQTPYFTGFLRKTFSFEKKQTNKAIPLELVSPSFFLDKNVPEKICLIDNTVSQIVTSLLSSAGITAVGTVTISNVVPVFTADEEETFSAILKTLLFEYGYVYDFDHAGSFQLLPLFNQPLSVVHEFSGTVNCYGAITQSASERKHDSVRASFKKIEYHQNILIFSDTQGATETQDCVIEISAGEYLFGEEENYLTYDSTQGEVVLATAITPDIAAETGIVSEITNSGKSALVTMRNTSAVTKHIYRLNIKGNAYVVASEGQAVSASGSSQNEIALKYISDADTAQIFAQQLHNYYQYSNFTVELKSKDNVIKGSFVSVSSEGMGTIIGRIIQKKHYFETELISYVIESVSDFVPGQIETISLKRPSFNLRGKSAYKIDIVSSNGLIFRPESRDTVLKARVWLGDVEVTESLMTSQFRWIRTSNDTAADSVWNQNHYVGYKEVTITPADFFARADFKCEIVEA